MASTTLAESLSMPVPSPHCEMADHVHAALWKIRSNHHFVDEPYRSRWYHVCAQHLHALAVTILPVAGHEVSLDLEPAHTALDTKSAPW
jgi:hypothetical protein